MASATPSAGPDRVAALLREAHLLRMRSRFVEAEEKVREAVALAPEDPAALEMLGDLLAEKGSIAEAVEIYRRAMERAPGRAVLEEKHARLVLMLADQQQERALAQMLLEDPRRAGSGRRRNPMHAFLLSAFLPGLGQLYNGEYLKGVLFLAGGFLTFLLGGESLLRLLFAVSGGRAAPSGLEAVFGFLSFLLWVAAMVDAPVRAQRSSDNAARRAGLL
jgi:tetratricopeptide (TPR) repeat protein